MRVFASVRGSNLLYKGMKGVREQGRLNGMGVGRQGRGEEYGK